MTDCHTALCDLGVSTSLVDSMMDAAVSAEALSVPRSAAAGSAGRRRVVDRPEAAWDVSRAVCTAGAVRTWTVPVAGLHAYGPAADQRFSSGMLVIEGSFQIDSPGGDA
jgi:hypothetical protein